MPIFYAIVLMSFSLAEATVSVGGEDCPQQFLGEVESIRSTHTQVGAFPTEEVTFRNQQSLRGDLPDEISIEVVSGGPFKLSEGQQYRVYLRTGKLCWLEEL
jgi:hypothetical protein